MREVVTLIVAECDRCHEKFEVPLAGPQEVQEVHWSWDGVEYVLDADRQCASVLPQESLSKLISMSREVPQALAKPSKKKSSKAGKDWKNLPRWDALLIAEGVYQCPFSGCDLVKTTGRGINQHHFAVHGGTINAQTYPILMGPNAPEPKFRSFPKSDDVWTADLMRERVDA